MNNEQRSASTTRVASRRMSGNSESRSRTAVIAFATSSREFSLSRRRRAACNGVREASVLGKDTP
jgi:hypothetical protein